jgi:hypothetical protein
MGYILGSEFIRNLHWPAFKPDRHVQRLLDRWMPNARLEVEPEVASIQRLLGHKTKDLERYLSYSLIGINATPPGVPITFTDNLVWLLAAYIEKKGRESGTVYVRKEE